MTYLHGLLMTLFVLVVLTLGTLEVVAIHSVRIAEPMRSGPSTEVLR